MKIYEIDSYKVRLNKKKSSESCGSIFTVYIKTEEGRYVKTGDGFLRYPDQDDEKDILTKLKRLLEKW